MFSTLESKWDHSARRGWTTLASFAMQALGLSLLLLIPLLVIQGPPKLHWFDTPTLTPPPAPAPLVRGPRPIDSSNIREGRIQEPPRIPPTIATLHEQPVASSPDVSHLGVDGGTGMARRGVFNAIGTSVDVAPPPPPPAPAHPLKVSHWAEGNVIYRVQPSYPPIARLARVQGTVELRAIISKAGTIENLIAVSGHPMLVKSAIEAVRQWRYRPYLLNNEPIEVETEITVNFVLSGS
jgi:periplasmic protein TonB